MAVLWLQNNLLMSPPSIYALLELGNMGCALSVLLFPDRCGLLLGMAACEALDMLLTLPYAPNHRLITCFVNLELLLAAAIVFRQDRALSPERIFKVFAPAARISLLIVYFFVAFHKLNSDFLSPAVSCTTVLYTHAYKIFPLLPYTALTLALLPVFTIVTEGLLPVLLAIRNTRAAGLFVALSFHSILALDTERHFFDFTSTMFGLLALYLEPAFCEHFARRFSGKLGILRKLRNVFIGIYLTAFLAGMFWEHRAFFLMFYDGRQILWWFFDAFVIWCYVSGLKDYRTPARSGLTFRFAGLMWIIPVIMLLNGVTPYLGIKTRSSFDMYSNLRIVGRSSNHLIFDRPLDLLGYSGDLVTIVETNDRFPNDEVLGLGMQMTYFEFQRLMRYNPEAAVKFFYRGEFFDVKRAADDPRFTKSPGFWISRLAWYRPVDPQPRNRCQW